MRKQNLLCAVVGVLAGVNAFAADGVKVGGFVDSQFQWNSVTTGFNAGGFKLGDAGLRFGAEDKDSSLAIELPVTAILSTVNGIFAGATSGLGSLKGQVYVAHKYSMGLSWKLGVFDSPFLIESNWSDRNWAATPGQVIGMAGLPKTFAGLMLNYMAGPVNVGLLVSDLRGTSTWGTGPLFTSSSSPDLGLQLGYGGEKDTFTAKVGFLYNSAVAVGYLIDAEIGLHMGSFKADIGFDMMNPATVSQMGIFVQPTFAINDTIGAGLRFEYVSTAPSVSTMQITAGPDFTMSKALKVRPQYTLTMPSPGTMSHGAVLSAVYSL